MIRQDKRKNLMVEREKETLDLNCARLLNYFEMEKVIRWFQIVI